VVAGTGQCVDRGDDHLLVSCIELAEERGQIDRRRGGHLRNHRDLLLPAVGRGPPSSAQVEKLLFGDVLRCRGDGVDGGPNRAQATVADLGVGRFAMGREQDRKRL